MRQRIMIFDTALVEITSVLLHLTFTPGSVNLPGQIHLPAFHTSHLR